MKDRKDKGPIQAAGGIVLRGDRKPRIAVVQLRKMDAWVLPKGKLADGEDALAAARREVLEETGHRVAVHEFLGTLAYEASGRPKVVQFWRMQALAGPVGPLMRDVKAVEWLPLDDALAQLTHPREQAFLQQVGPMALQAAERLRRVERPSRRRPSAATVVRAPVARPVRVPELVVRSAEEFVPIDLVSPPVAPAAPPWAADAAPAEGHADGHTNGHSNEPSWRGPVQWPAPDTVAAPGSDILSTVTFASPEMPARDHTARDAAADATAAEAAASRTMLERAWTWLRQATQPAGKL